MAHRSEFVCRLNVLSRVIVDGGDLNSEGLASTFCQVVSLPDTNCLIVLAALEKGTHQVEHHVIVSLEHLLDLEEWEMVRVRDWSEETTDEVVRTVPADDV